MSFLKNIFKKKPGGTGIGNLFRGVSSAATGGVLGSGLNKIELGQTQTNKQLGSQPLTTFAGQPATQLGDTVTMQTPMAEIPITSPSSIRNSDTTLEKIGDLFKPILSRATEGVNVGADNRTLWIVGGCFAALVATLLYTNSNR